VLEADQVFFYGLALAVFSVFSDFTQNCVSDEEQEERANKTQTLGGDSISFGKTIDFCEVAQDSEDGNAKCNKLRRIFSACRLRCERLH
jgi:hypothetical protein